MTGKYNQPFYFSFSSVHPPPGAARWHPCKPNGGAAPAPRNPQKTQRVHAGGDRCLPQAVDAVCRAHTNTGRVHKQREHAGVIVYETQLHWWMRTHCCCAHKHQIILDVEFHTVQQRDTEKIPDVLLVGVERGQHAHRGGHSQSCSYMVLHICSDHSIKQTSEVYSSFFMIQPRNSNGLLAIHSRQTTHTFTQTLTEAI